MDKNKKIIAIVVGVVLLGGSFYSGTIYAKSGSRGSQFGGANAFSARGISSRTGGGVGNVAMGGGIVSGQILSKDASSITVKMKDGGSKIVFLLPTTPVTKTVSGTLDDLTVGQEIMANGKAGADGSISAETIQIRPAGLTMPAGSRNK
ncbi:MAG: hypothetical protein AAB965_01310 [Patescibacteria group bacterium]